MQLRPTGSSVRSIGARFQTARVLGASDKVEGKLLAVEPGRGRVQLGVLTTRGAVSAIRAPPHCEHETPCFACARCDCP